MQEEVHSRKDGICEVSGLTERVERLIALAKDPGNNKILTITFVNGHGYTKFEGEGWCGKDIRACFTLITKGYRRHNAELYRQRKGQVTDGNGESGNRESGESGKS